jgi:Fe-Mn family superoxide dismutase
VDEPRAEGRGAPSGELGTAIDRDFGSFTGFKAQLTAAASTLQGSGWGALSFEPLGARLIVQQIYDHQSNVGTGTVPLLVIDMWEHAYYLRYKNRKNEWIDAFWELVNCADVEARFASAPRSTARVELRRVAARTASAR